MEKKSSEGANALRSLSQDLADTVEKAGRSVVAIHARQRIPSSGVVWGQGVIVSADHTIKRDEEITVTAPEGRIMPAALAGRDPTTGLAVLKIEDNDLSVAELADPSLLRVGHLVLAIGRAGQLSASLGVIGALGGAWRTWQGGQLDRFIRPDVSVHDGFSGGPLVDTQGRVVGINTSGLWRNTPLTIPAATAGRVAKELLEKGRIARAYLGAGMQPVRLPETFRNKLSLTGKVGLVIVNAEPGGPAEKSGMLLGDVLVALEGEPVGNTGDVQAMLGPERVGKLLKALVIRGGVLAELAITAGERPARVESMGRCDP